MVRASGPTGPRKVADSVVDAWVPMSLADDDPAVMAALERRLPVVTQGGPRLPGVPCVTVDNVAASRGAVEHLVGLGHRRLGVVTWGLGRTPRAGLADAARQAAAPVAVWRERLLGVRHEIETAGLDWSAVPVLERPGNSPGGRARGRPGAAGRRRRPARPDRRPRGHGRPGLRRPPGRP